MEPTRSKIELQTIPIKSVDPKDQINAKAKVVKICDPRVKLFERELGDVEASKSHPWYLHDRRPNANKRHVADSGQAELENQARMDQTDLRSSVGQSTKSPSVPADCDNRKRARTKRRPLTWHVPPRTDVVQSMCCG
jgi:hypothetical protein